MLLVQLKQVHLIITSSNAEVVCVTGQFIKEDLSGNHKTLIMKITAKIINAFSVNGTGGNPAGVVLNADNFSNEQKQQIAKRLGLSETAFVSGSKVADYKMDFFTPVKQIPHCGHATIATFTYLKKMGLIENNNSSKETIDGIRQIFFKHGLAFMEQRKPTIRYLPDELEAILHSLQLASDDLIPGKLPAIVNTGNNFLMVPLKEEKTLAVVQPDLSAVSAVSEKYNLIGFYLFTPTGNAELHATTRMFGPYYGIPEEAGTGMAAGPLACYLYKEHGIRLETFHIEQGRFMADPSPSLLQVELVIVDGQIEKLYVGGDAYVSKQISITI